ncbi:MAG: hypothetical protein DHS20C02_12020 [Micavibrio sp.]|nr:MAG: hypothetical protein DHS20C02_12020 [Micavibrio sp.]
MTTEPKLSKSQYLKGLQCPKALWFYRHRKDLAPETDAATQARFDTGHDIGVLAQQYFEGGVEVTNEYWDITGAITSTEQFVKDGHDIIYEATAMHPVDGSYSRIDILRKVAGTDAWDLIEVKSSTGIKGYHIDDVSLQYHVFYHAGYKIRKCFMMVIDNSYVRDGEIDPQALFKLEDISEHVFAKQSEVEYVAGQLGYVLDRKKEPEAEIGARCNSPFECDYKAHCWKHVPEYSVFNVYAGKKADEIVGHINSFDIQNIPVDLLPGGSKRIDISCFQDDKVHIDEENLRVFLGRLQYPLYYLDYETLGPAIPIFDGTGPYNQIPFQFSLHVQTEPNAKLLHHEFLHKELSDPRRPMTEALIDLCSDNGSVIVYSQTFEEGCNNKLAEAFPEYSTGLQQINQRMVDLLIPFRKRWLYHPAQMGSASIKYVLPAFTDLSYEDMGIANGMEASGQYQAFAEGRLPKPEHETLWNNLSEYCELDTLAMVKLVDVIREAMVEE